MSLVPERSDPDREVGAAALGTLLDQTVPQDGTDQVAAAALRAHLNDELGFCPAKLDDESIAE